MVRFHETADGAIELEFKNGRIARGKLLIGADGANSRTRQALCPDTWQLNQLPIRLLGTTVRLSSEEIRPLREIDPLLFHGCCPETGTFM